jgi:O-antigen/teichoic acid export membrane protein
VAALAAVVVVPGCVLLAFAARPLLAAGLGEEFRDAAPALRIVLAAAALAPLWALSTQLAAGARAARGGANGRRCGRGDVRRRRPR